jgi:DNA-binding NtrC family response regulator
MDKKGRILIVDDNEDILFALKLLLKPHVEKVTTLSSPTNLMRVYAKDVPDVVLLDMNFTQDAISGKEGFHYLKKLKQLDPNATVIFITAYGDAEKAVKALKEGATDFIVKPWQNEKILATISSAIELSETKQEASELRNIQEVLNEQIDQPFQDFIGESPEMKSVFKLIEKVAPTDANVLILGENGTGKELVARAICRNSERKNKVCVSVDLGSITETLFESELFGYEKGAFTDAKNDKPGRFEIASGGTLFLDEIGNLPMHVQTKLLRVLETREIIRVGGTTPRKIDIRLIAATNNNIHQDVADNNFRQDLLYRINTVEIHLPPLRDRQGDVEVLSSHFVKQFSKKYKKKIKGIAAEALKKLNVYSWPGNVRELQHATERAVIMSDSNMLSADDFMLSNTPTTGEEFEFDSMNLDDIEKQIIQKALKMNKGNITQAAQVLGLTRTSLYRRMEKHDL